jgi:sarcosine oxidase
VCEKPSFGTLLQAVGQRHGAVSEAVSADYRQAIAFRAPPDASFIIETGDAGVVNPRLLVQCQLAAAVTGGVTLVRRVVVGVRSTGGGVEVVLDDGSSISASRVLVAAGGSVNVLVGQQSLVRAIGITAALFRLDDAAREATLDLPGFLWYPAGDEYEFVYGVPPTPYPDGHRYVKLGVVRRTDVLDGADSIGEWCRRGGSKADVDWLRDWAGAHLPAIAAGDVIPMGCTITETDSDGPVIAEVDPGVWMVTGCDGAAAKSCDEIGRLAGRALAGR